MAVPSVLTKPRFLNPLAVKPPKWGLFGIKSLESECQTMLTPGIARWLRALADNGVMTRPKTNVGYRAMRKGYTDWVQSNGVETMSWQEFHRRFEPSSTRYDGWATIGEQLTDLGRKALVEHEQSQNAADAKTPPVNQGRDEARAKGQTFAQARIGTNGINFH